MDNSSPLYLAHQSDRKAEIHVQFKRFDEALICHQKAAELLQNAMTLTKVTKALESLKLQEEYHNKQKDIIRVKKYQFDKRKAFEYKKLKMVSEKKSQDSKDQDQDLPRAIFRAMKEADSLLDQLYPSVTESGDLSTETPPASPSSTIRGFKKPKDDKLVIEELRTLNTQLRTLISELVTQLKASERQVEMLRARLRESRDASAIPTSTETNVATAVNSTTSVQAAADMVAPSSLPYLAPLEMPKFNFNDL